MYNENEDFNSLDENLETGNELQVDEAEIVDTQSIDKTDSDSVGNSYNPLAKMLLIGNMQVHR